MCPSFIEGGTVKGVGLRVANSHTSNHYEDDFTPLETIRRFLGVIGSRSLWISKGRPLIRIEGLYTHFFILSNLRIPLPEFFFEVLNYFKMHISCFNPFGLSKLTTFAVMCKAYNSKPSLDLLRAFLNLGPTGNWLTLSNRVPSKYLELLLEDNKLDKKSFKDVIPQHVQDNPVYNLIATYPVNIRTFLNPILYLACLKTSWEHTPKNLIIYYHREGTYYSFLLDYFSISANNIRFLVAKMDFRSFMMEGVDGEFHFSPEGGIGNEEANSPSMIFVNIETLVTYAEPITVVAPSQFVKNMADSDDAPSEKDKVILIDCSVADKVKKRKCRGVVILSLYYVEFPSAKELKDSADCHRVMAHVTPPSWKQRLKDIILEKICNIHDKAYMRQVVLDNVMNRRTRKLMSTLLKAKTACNAISKREKEKDKVYAELEAKCNDALKDLDKNFLILDMRAEIETFDEMGLLVSHLVKIALVHDRCLALEEASDNLATPSYPFLTNAIADLYASLEILLSKKRRSLRSKSAPSQSKSKPSSLKVPNPDN
ncbi:hypothetical protein Tco_1025711 [Tanacetum coccineum]